MEMEVLKGYIKENNIEELMLELTETLLKEKPDNPSKFLIQKLEKEVGTDLAGEGGEAAAKRSSIHGQMGVEVPGAHLLKLFESTRKISMEIVPKETIQIIIEETIQLLECDRVSLFVYDKSLGMLVLTASNLTKPIRVNPGQGISGHVFKTQETINIPDCYQDDRFDPAFDKATGYRTKSSLTMPIVDFESQTIGVLQAINKKEDGIFSQVDELLLGHLTQHAGIALRNAEVYRDAIIQSERANGLLHMIQSLSQDLGTQSLILTITMHVNELVQADRCTVFLHDEGKEQLWSVSTDSGKEIRIPRNKGIAGECCTSAQLINIKDAYQDPRFNQEFDKKTGYHTQSILAVPVMDQHDKRCLAVIQMINKKEFDGEVGVFQDDDVDIMTTFAKFVGTKLATSSLLSGKGKKEAEGSKAFGDNLKPGVAKGPHISEQSAIVEGDEDEED